MAISSAGGKILESAVTSYPRMATFQPVINGVAGNLVMKYLHIFNQMNINTQYDPIDIRLECMPAVSPPHCTNGVDMLPIQTPRERPKRWTTTPTPLASSWV